MVSSEALSIPDCHSPVESYTLSRRIPAVQLVQIEGPKAQLGPLVQLPKGAQLDLCGDGFDERTVKVRCDTSFYFVFLEDLRSML
jgi:hypothetical protein